MTGRYVWPSLHVYVTVMECVQVLNVLFNIVLTEYKYVVSNGGNHFRREEKNVSF